MSFQINKNPQQLRQEPAKQKGGLPGLAGPAPKPVEVVLANQSGLPGLPAQAKGSGK